MSDATVFLNWIDIICSVIAAVVAVVAFRTAKQTHNSQMEHNRQSVRPILNIVVDDYEDHI